MLSNTIYYLLLILTIMSETELENPPSNVYIIGHRGASGYAPENTVAAFDLAIVQNVDYIEIDIQMTRDGELVVIHDRTIDRTTNGSGSIRNTTYPDLRKLDAGSWYHSTFKSEKIPSFREVIERYAKKVGLLIELKDPHLYPGIEQKLSSELRSANLLNRTDGSIIIQSFNHSAIRKFHRLLPQIPTGILTLTRYSSNELKNISTYCSYINSFTPTFHKEYAKLLQKHHLKSFVWPVNNRKLFETIADYGINGIITDYPDKITNRNENGSYPYLNRINRF